MTQQLSNMSAPAIAPDSPTAHDGTMRYAAKSAPAAGRRALGVIRLLVGVNLGLVGLQAVSAGAFLSGNGRAVTAHALVSVALQVGALLQAVAAVVQWRRRRVPAWVAGVSLGLLTLVFLQAGLGHSKRFWLHVPLGVALCGGLVQQASRLDALRRAGDERT